MNKKEHAVKLKAIDVYIEPKAPCGKPWSIATCVSLGKQMG